MSAVVRAGAFCVVAFLVTLATERWEFPATDGVTENALGSASGSSRVNERKQGLGIDKVFTGELLR